MSRDTSSTDGEPLFGRLRRRGVLRSVGAGAALSVGGYGFASQDGEDGETPTPTEGQEETGPIDRGCDPCIDTVTGYHVLAEEQEPPVNLQADHLVDMRVADVDVLFQEPDDDSGGTPTETPAGNETATPVGNETATPTPTPVGNETATPTEGTPTDEGQEGEEGGDGPEPMGFPDFFFDPVGLLVRPGEVVEFTTMAPEVPAPGPVEHTVTAFHPRTGFSQRVPDGAPGFSSGPIYAEESWLYQFEAEGVYDVLCLPHFGLGMVMRLVVMAEDSEAVPEEPPELQETDEMAPPNPASVLAADELDPQNIVEQEAVAWTDLSDIATEPPMDGPGGGAEGEDGEGGGPDGEGDGGADGAGEQGDAGEGNEP